LYLLVSSAKLLEDALRTEKNVDVRERLLLLRRVLVDNEQTARVAEKELHRSRWGAYKWVKRYTESGLKGLKNLPRAGRPPQVSGQKFAEIKRELSKNLAGWRAKEGMNIIYEKTGVRYHEVHIYRLLHKWGFSPKVPRQRFVNTASNKEKKQFKKRLSK
jgi:putative transposase